MPCPVCPETRSIPVVDDEDDGGSGIRPPVVPHSHPPVHESHPHFHPILSSRSSDSAHEWPIDRASDGHTGFAPFPDVGLLL